MEVRDLFSPLMQKLLNQLFNWFEAGLLNPRVNQIFSLDNFQEAMATVLGRRSLGRVAVVMGDETKRLVK